MKKFISLFLVLLMVVAILPAGIFSVTAKAEEVYKDKFYYYYTVSDDKATITEVGYGLLGDITVPSTLGGYPVVSIAEDAFKGCTGITSVIIPEGIESIGKYAFSTCRQITSITIPKSVTSIGDCAFLYCTSLLNITVDEDNQNYCSQNGVLFTEDKTVLIKYPVASDLTQYDIPQGVEKIDAGAFYGCTSLANITLPQGTASIEYSAFYNCVGLESVTIAGSVKSIGDNAFYGCSNLSGLTICEGVETIGEYAFFNCTKLTSLTLPDSVISIGEGSFGYCNNLASVTLSENIESIGYGAFYACSSIKSITIPEGVKSIDAAAFEYCTSLTEISIPEGITSIAQEMFYGCKNLTKVTIPEGVTSIGTWAFTNCTNLTNITLPESLTGIANGAFKNCTSLLEINIPEECNIGENAFYGCSSLSDVTISDGVTSIGNAAFYGCIGLESIVIPDSVTSIGNEVFYGCIGLESIVIPDSVVSIGNEVFYGCTALKTAVVSKGVESFGNKTFYGCTGLEAVTIPEGIESIGEYAFYECGSLSNITLPQSITSIGTYAFFKCEGLNEVTIPDSVTSIEQQAFYGCTGIKELTIPGSVEDITTQAFCGCSGLETLIISEGVKNINSYAFAQCSNLNTVTIPKSIEKIGGYAFEKCTGIKLVNYAGIHDDWMDISISSGNTCLTYAKREHNYHTHSYTKVVTAPTCTEQGYTTYLCEFCDDFYIDDVVDIDSYAHDYAIKDVVAPTESKQGYTCYVCNRCENQHNDNFTNLGDVIGGVKVSLSDVDVTLLWDSFDGAVEYYAKVYDKEFTTCLKTIATTNTSAVFSSSILHYDTDYRFIVTAKLSSGKYLPVATATHVVGGMVVGDRVVGLEANIEGKGAVVNFHPVENAEEYMVNVFENDAQGTRVYTAAINKDTTSARVMNNLTAGTKYVVMINVKLGGKWTALADLRVNGIGISFTAPVVNPTSVTIVDETATSVRFNWDAVRGATEYYVRVKLKSTGKLVNTIKVVGKTTATLSRWTNGTKISSNTTYTLEICAYVPGVEATYGEPIDITTKGFEKVWVTAEHNNNKINLSWNKTTNSVGYFVYTYKNGVKINTKYIDGADNNSYEFTAPTKSGKYMYGVVVYEKNSSGTAYTPMSTSVTVTIS